MTEAEMKKIVEAVEAFDVPGHLVDRAKILLMTPAAEARAEQLRQLSQDVGSHFKLDGELLDTAVSACIMRASLDLTGRLP